MDIIITEITVIKQKLEDYKKRNLTTIKKKKTESKEIEENNEMSIISKD